MNSNKVVKNASWIIICSIFQAILSFIIGTLTARYLGPSNYGLINYASSIVTFFIPIVKLGFTATLVQEIINNPEKEGKILGTAITVSFIFSIIGIIFIAFIIYALNGNTITLTVCILYSLSLIFQAFELIQYWFQAKLLSKYTSIVALISYIVVSAYKFFLLYTNKDIKWFAISNAFDYFLIAGSLLIIYKIISKQKLSFSFQTAKELLSRSKYYIISGIMVTIFSVTDKIMITLMIGEEYNGYYSAAVACAGITSVFFSAVITSVRPMIFQYKKEDNKLYEESISKLYSVIIYVALLQSIMFLIFSSIIVKILYGDDYTSAVSILRIITWYTAFSYMGSVRNIWILAEKKHSVIWKINLIGAILNIVLNLILIPILKANGAALASVITQLFTNFILCLLMPSLKEHIKLMLRGFNPKYIFIALKEFFRAFRKDKGNDIK